MPGSMTLPFLPTLLLFGLRNPKAVLGPRSLKKGRAVQDGSGFARKSLSVLRQYLLQAVNTLADAERRMWRRLVHDLLNR